MADLGWPELSIIALAVVLLFGWKRMPDMARSLGRSARIFKSEVDQMRSGPDAPDGSAESAIAGPDEATISAADDRAAAPTTARRLPTPRSPDCVPSSRPGSTPAGRTSLRR